MEQLVEYSYILCVDANDVVNETQFIYSLMNKGIKVLLFTNKEIKFDIPEEDLEAFKKSKLFSCMVEDCYMPESFTIIDGRIEGPELETLKELFPRFNIEQYKIEHAPSKENIMVKAGAGTGKTTVMVDRILYLLIKEKVEPSEIVMITFTRDAAKNMARKLRELLFHRFEATRSKTTLDLIEKLSEIHIKTIHAFSKSLLKELGSLRGFGLNPQLRSFKSEKKKWIEEELNNYFKEELADSQTVIESIISPLKLYELIDTLYDFWEKFEQKGFSSDDIINRACFGSASGSNEKFNGLIETVIKNAEKRFVQEKEEQNAVMINDLTRQIDLIREEHGYAVFKKLSAKISYIFVDEFQDSDDVQIRLIATIQEAFGSILFVVGDTKQSIYRFRGAIHTAFEILKDMLKLRNIDINDKDYFLNKNYRTSSKLLKEMDEYFAWWGEKKFLQYNEESGRLVGMIEGEEEHPLTLVNKREDTKENMRDNIVPFVKERFRQVQEANSSSGKEPEKLAVLTRTIDEARLVSKWCEEEKLPVKLTVGGGFFSSKPVRHFYSLLLSLLYPNNGKYLANVLDGPFGQAIKSPLPRIIEGMGSPSKINEAMEQSAGLSFGSYANRLSYQPVLVVLRSIIEDGEPYNWVYSRQLDSLKAYRVDGYTEENLDREAKAYARQYELNIGKLFEMIHQKFSQEFVSLSRLVDWLYIQIATNRDEEEISLESVNGGIDYVNILTAHRAKGLEFYTVIIPFTERLFTASFSKIIFDSNKEKIGWLINKPGYEERVNDFYDSLVSNDESETIKEEARLLYVAMTRAKNQLVIIRNLKNDAFNWTWSKLLTKYR